jgi:hypothetical protein
MPTKSPGKENHQAEYQVGQSSDSLQHQSQSREKKAQAVDTY